mmetsp:Transcript_139428/g.197370  ORF Transcript_139428/g.197370 Transcript_139428/m.197370 type:complete len:206 (-) Transcript_139428:875-1492(-)
MPSCSSSTRRVRLRPGAKGPGGGVAWTCLGSRTLPLRELCPSKIHHAASPERLPVHHQGDLFTWRPSPHTARPASLRMPYPAAPSGAVPAGANGARDKQPPEGGSSARPASVRQLRDAEDPQPRNARPAALALPSPRASCPRFDHRPERQCRAGKGNGSLQVGRQGEPGQATSLAAWVAPRVVKDPARPSDRSGADPCLGRGRAP